MFNRMNESDMFINDRDKIILKCIIELKGFIGNI